jgi:ankyrin repeat protein
MALEEKKGQVVTAWADVYEQTMSRVKQQVPYRAALANQILTWLAHARRGLTVAELQHALITQSLQRGVDSQDWLDTDELLTICAGLVTADRSRNVVQLAHHSVGEYLKLETCELLPRTDQDITRTCLACLSFNRFPEGDYTQWQDLEEWLTSYPFYKYAATNWGHHARESSLPKEELMDFLDDRSAVKNSIAVLMVDKSFRAHTYVADPPKPESVTSLHLVTHFRLTDLVQELLSTAPDSDPGDSQGRTPLSYAAELGYEDIVYLFLQAGAEVNSRGLEDHANTGESSWLPTKYGGHAGRTPLSFAAEYGHVNTSKLLLSYGADPGSECSKHRYQGWTPLLFAVHHGHENVVSLLLGAGANPEQPSMNNEDVGKTALSHAAEKGHMTIVRILLEQGVNTEPTIMSTDLDTTGHTPLWLAASRGHEAVMKILLGTGKGQLNLQDKSGRTILSYMAEQGHEAMVRVLLEGGADQYLEDNEGETPRSRAIRNPDPEVIAMFEQFP